MKIVLPGLEKDLNVYLVWIGYENDPKEIFRMADPWIGHVDGMVAGDGKFDFFPADNDYSKSGWLQAAEKRYKDKCDFIGYEFAGKQVDKRQKYLDLAGKAGADVAIAIDTDDYIDPNWMDFDRFYKQLLTLLEYTKDRVFYQWVYIPSEELWAKQGNEFPSNRWLPSARIHKDPGTMRYCMDRHYIWCSKNVTDEALIKWQLDHRGRDNPYQFSPRNIVDGVRMRMDRLLRSKEFNEKEAIWAKMNQHAENSREYYKIAKLTKVPPPEGYTWDTWAKKPHTFDPITGQRLELDEE